MSQTNDFQKQVQLYDSLVQGYQRLCQQINDLLTRYGGRHDEMPEADLAQYRHLATQRDDLFNEMRALEQELLPDEDA